MYSIVLAAALVTTSGTPNWHNNGGGYGCSAIYSSCYGYNSGYGGYSGYSGYAGYPGYQPYTCHAGGGCYRTIPGYNGGSGYGWAGGCYGYHGGCYGAGYGATYGAGYAPTVYGAYYIHPSQTYGQGCYGCYGGYAGYGIPVVPEMPLATPKAGEGVKDPFPPINPDPNKKGEPIPAPAEKKLVDPKKEPEKLSRATIQLEIPEGGKLFVDGRPIAVTAGTRQFETPPLAAGQQFFYDFRLELVVHGEMRRDERRVIVRANQEVAIDFSRSPAIATR